MLSKYNGTNYYHLIIQNNVLVLSLSGFKSTDHINLIVFFINNNGQFNYIYLLILYRSSRNL